MELTPMQQANQWKPGDPTFALVVLDGTLPNYIDRLATRMAHIGTDEALRRLVELKPNAVTYVPGLRCVFAVWTHAERKDRRRVLYIYNLSAYDFYHLVDHRLKYRFEYAVGSTSVRYSRPHREPNPLF